MNPLTVHKDQIDPLLVAQRFQSAPSEHNTIKKKEGYLYKKSDHLKQWRKRYFICENNFLKISHDTSGKKLRIIDLNNYSPSYQGNINDKYVFVFTTRQGLKLEPQSLVLGSTDEGLARDWFKFLLSVMDINSILSGQTHIINELGLRVKSQSEKKDIDKSDFSSSQEASNIEKIEEFIPEIPVLVKRRSVSLDARHADQTKESSSEVEPVDKKVVNYKHPELSIDSEEKTATENIVINNRPSSQFLREKSSSFSNKTTVLRKGSRHSIKAIEYFLPKEAPKWVEHIFEKYIKGKTMWKVPTEEKINHDEWNIIQDNGQFRIMQSKKKSTVFKCLFSLENGASPEKLLQVLLDVQNRHKWDRSFDKAVLLSFIPSTKQCTVHQVNKPYGMLYLPRDFVYTRYVFKASGDYFIIDKSMPEPNSVAKPLRCSRGEIFYSSKHFAGLFVNKGLVMQIKKEGYEVYLNLLLNITNGGLVNSNQDTQMTLASLTNINNIFKVINQYEEWNSSQLALLPSADNETRKESISESLLSMEKERESIKIRVEESKEEDIGLIINQTFTERSQKCEDISEEEKEEEIDLNLLLEKIKRQEPTLECIDKSILKKKLTKIQAEALISNEENYLLNGKTWKKDPANGLRFIDEEFLSKQKKVLGYFLRSMGKNFLEGKSIMNVSLPITIFGNESMLQRCCSSYGYAISLFTLAGQQTDPLEAFKYAVAGYFSGGNLGIAQIKPFNPILGLEINPTSTHINIGETYQGYLNNIPIACEQISHHPPISAIFMKAEEFLLYGNQQLDASLGANSATASDKRRMCVSLPRLKMDIYAYFPTALVSGTTFGKRYFNWSKKLRVYEPNHNLYIELLYNPDEKGMIGNLFSKKTLDADKAIGSIYKVTPEFMSALHRKESIINTDSKAKFVPKEHGLGELSKADGCWTSYLDFDGKRYWDLEEAKPYKLVDQPNKALPSDSNFREDLIYKKMNDLDKGQIAKDKLENIQRADRKLRAKTSKPKH